MLSYLASADAIMAMSTMQSCFWMMQPKETALQLPIMIFHVLLSWCDELETLNEQNVFMRYEDKWKIDVSKELGLKMWQLLDEIRIHLLSICLKPENKQGSFLFERIFYSLTFCRWNLWTIYSRIKCLQKLWGIQDLLTEFFWIFFLCQWNNPGSPIPGTEP